MLSAPFNQAHEKHTKKTYNRACKRAQTIGNKVHNLEITSEMRLTELDCISTEKRERESSEQRQQIQDNDPVVHSIVEAHEKKEPQGHVSQKMCPLILTQNILGHGNVLSQRQIDYRSQTNQAEYEANYPHCL